MKLLSGDRGISWKTAAKFLALALVLAFSTVSCTGPRAKEKGAALGATIGAATGATVGAIIGHDGHASGEGAGVGIVFGGLIGALVGSAMSEEEPGTMPEAKQEAPAETQPEMKAEEAPPAPAEPEMKAEEVPPPAAEPETRAEVAPAPAEPAPGVTEEEGEMVAQAEVAGEGLQDIHFAFDRSVIRPDAQVILEKNVNWIKNNPDARIQIQGHCDERGTVEYNLALGERRARSTRDYLVALGANPDQLSLISYGEERPVDPDHTEEAWAKNRRAHFEIMR